MKTLPGSPLYLLFHSWSTGESGRRYLADLIVNVALYLPLGISGFLAIRGRIARFAAPVLTGALLSACIEMTQLFTPTRNCSTSDLIENIAGSALGVLAGMVFERFAPRVRVRGQKPSDPSAVALLFCWVAAMLFPVFPVTQLGVWHSKLLTFVHGSMLSPVILISEAASWIAIAFMLQATQLRNPGLWLFLSTLLIAAQWSIITRQPLPVHFVGAFAGILIWCVLRKMANPLRMAACIFLLILAIRGLAPFHFSSGATPFAWTPFEPLLNTEWQYGIQILLEKLFYYCSAVWLLRAAGVRWTLALCIVATMLGTIEAVQTHIPGRTPEITDPLLALVGGIGLWVLRGRQIGYDAIS